MAKTLLNTTFRRDHVKISDCQNSYFDVHEFGRTFEISFYNGNYTFKTKGWKISCFPIIKNTLAHPVYFF